MPDPDPPQVLHRYRNLTVDSARWQRFEPRDDDIIISTSYKSGTTWTQAILAHLLLDVEAMESLTGTSLWLDNAFPPIEAVLERLESQQHRRFIKTHLPLDGLPFYPQVRYVVVGRDARDVFMSLWNHHTSYTDEVWAWMVERATDQGRTLDRPSDIHAFWHDWITRGWAPWEREGYPYWGNLHHTATWWRYRHLDNILFLHYADMLADLPAELRRLVDFLGIDASDERLAEVAEATTFGNMRANADRWMPGIDQSFQGGGPTFVFKGTNGRWRGVLSDDELALYERAKRELLEPECAAWLEGGRGATMGR